MSKAYSFLALGDSYTIGEQVSIHKSFPYQLVQALRKTGISVQAPEIIARTGWTTEELKLAMDEYVFQDSYDLITLLTGVNNQYRKGTTEEYQLALEHILQLLIKMTSKTEHIIIISIPDYSVTPYCSGSNQNIAREIEMFNSLNKALSIQYKTEYLDITPESILLGGQADFIAPDGLHPTEKMYALWADKLTAMLAKRLK